ncbi:MAG: PQQ-dependent sugar dehydrogenase, partial [Actinobacteria bacterium]|nr:PQQ-dependent sugar dehydrogenase [Actinomycetota bacterium]
CIVTRRPGRRTATRVPPAGPGRRDLARALVAVALLVGLALVTGCSGDDDAGRSRAERTRSSASTTNGSAATAAEDRPIAPGALRLVDLGVPVEHPTDLTFRPRSTSLLIAERGGAIREAVADGEGFHLADGAVIDLGAAVGPTDVERGLLGIAVAPDGKHVYASYTEATHGDSRIDEYPLSGRDGSLRADPAGRRQLVTIVQPFPNHNGGSLRFGPDGMLYAGFGDGGGAGDPNGNGQSRATLLGKVLRIDPSTADGIPKDNPFVDEPGAEPLIWLTGVRNPWRIDVDPPTGDLWIGDVGENRFEEIDLLTEADGAGRGANLGWNLFEGTSRFDRPKPAPGAASAGPFTAPIFTYSHDQGCSITGGVVVRDPTLPGLTGA